MKRRRAGRNQDFVAVEVNLRAAQIDFDDVRRHERRAAAINVNAVAPDVVVNQFPTFLDNDALAVHEIADADVGAHRNIDAIKPALLQTGQLQRAFAQRLGRNRSGIDARAARSRFLFDQRDAFAEIRRLTRAFFARRPGTDDNEVVVLHIEYSILKKEP